MIAARLQVKGGLFCDLPLTKELSDSLEEWFAFLESVRGVRLRGGGVDFAESPLVFLGRDGAPELMISEIGTSSLTPKVRHFRLCPKNRIF